MPKKCFEGFEGFEESCLQIVSYCILQEPDAVHQGRAYFFIAFPDSLNQPLKIFLIKLFPKSIKSFINKLFMIPLVFLIRHSFKNSYLAFSHPQLYIYHVVVQGLRAFPKKNGQIKNNCLYLQCPFNPSSLCPPVD
jgi:hypothetical protein